MNTVIEKLELLLTTLGEKVSESTLYKEFEEVLKQKIDWNNLRQDQIDLLQKADQMAKDIETMTHVVPNYLNEVHRIVVILQMNVIEPSCVTVL